MKAKQIGPEGALPFIYCGFGSRVPKSGDVIMGYHVRYEAEEYIRQNLDKLPNVRMVLVPWLGRNPHALTYFLHWPSPSETIDLDEKVFTDRYSDADFRSSIKTVYSKTHCFTCGRNWHTLIVNPADSYLGAPGLFEKKLAARESIRCPACGASLRQLVVMIIEEALESEC